MKTYHEDIVACYLYTITRHGYPPNAGDTLRHMEEFAGLGFRSIELEGIREEHLEGMYAQRQELRKKADALNLEVPVCCVVLPGLSSADDVERQMNLELFAKGCELAHVLGSEAVLDNAPIPPYQFPGGIPVTRHYDEEVLGQATLPEDFNWDRYWDALVETFREACDIAAERYLSYHLHPCYGALVNSTDAYLLFAESVKRDNLKFNLDTANQYFMKDNIYLSLMRLHPHIEYIHVSDNGGEQMEHLAIGEGKINWAQFFDTLDRIGYRGRFGIDIGGAESEVSDLDGAYHGAAEWLQENWLKQ